MGDVLALATAGPPPPRRPPRLLLIRRPPTPPAPDPTARHTHNPPKTVHLTRSWRSVIGFTPLWLICAPILVSTRPIHIPLTPSPVFASWPLYPPPHPASLHPSMAAGAG
eukprot:506052-Prorocentrum_minimum.AAC.3